LLALTVVLADNQEAVAKQLAELGAAFPLVHPSNSQFQPQFLKFSTELADTKTYLDMSSCAAAMVDGKGWPRVVSEVFCPELKCRKAGIADAKQVFEWRYDGESEKYYNNNTVPSFEDHANWFYKALDDPNIELLIFELHRTPVCHIRLDRLNGEPFAAELSIYVDKKWRGLGVGRHVLSQIGEVAQNLNISCIEATVHQENIVSVRAFKSTGFAATRSNGGFLKFTKSIDVGINSVFA
jgi:RimJ/RimL family protein N-acetyltransferase